MNGEDGLGRVVEPCVAAVAEVTLTVRLSVVMSNSDDRLRRARGAADQIGPRHVTNGLEAFGIVDKVANVDHGSVL